MPATRDSDWLAPFAERMKQAITAMERDFRRVQIGRASAALVEHIQVDHRGVRAPLEALATVTAPEPRLIVIEPWDRSALLAVAKAISHSGIGLSPALGGSAIRLYIPALSAERRAEMAGVITERARAAQVEIRRLRHEAIAVIRPRGAAKKVDDAVARELKRLDAITDGFIGEIDRLTAAKAAELQRL
jgi:ribosome recycling factor